jgi:non-ribosomal peptide synthetase component F
VLGSVSADAWLQAGTALGVAIILLAAGAMRHWAVQVRADIREAQADMIRVADQARRDTQHSLAVISSQIHDIFAQLDDTRQRLSRVEALAGQPPGPWVAHYQPPLKEPPEGG